MQCVNRQQLKIELPSAFQRGTHNHQSQFCSTTFPEIWQGQNTANILPNHCHFRGQRGSDRSRGALAPCLVPFRPDLLRPKTCSALSPFGAKNNDTQILCLLCAVLRYFLNTQVSYHVFRLMSKLEIFHLCIKIFVCFFENQLL